MRSLTAAGLVVLGVLVLGGIVLLGSGSARGGPMLHTCSATDRQFIRTASLNLTALGAWGEDYLQGDASAAEVVGEARQAAEIVSGTSPSDPSLKKARKLMNAMFVEYGRAIQARSRRRDAGPHMYRAYGLANFTRRVLVGAKPDLLARGCDVTSLL